MSEKIIKVEHLQQFFPAGGFGKNKKYVRAVDDVSFYIEKGETLGLVGESGCGKTTTGRSLLRLYEPTDGRIIYNDKVLFDSGKVPLVDDKGNDIIENGVPKLGKKIAVNMSEYRKKLQIVFQDPYASLDPRMTVGDIIGEAIDINKIASSKKDRQDRIIEVLRTVGLNSEHANRYPHEFSGGQRQRVGIARALVVNPDFIVADEPVSALDVSIQAQVVNLLKDLQKQRNLTLLFIAHDLSMVKYISDRVAVMYRGKVVELGKPEDVYNNPVHSYTKSLISAVPVADPDFTRHEKVEMEETYLRSPVGDVSEINYIPEESELTEYKPGHFVETSFLLEHKLI